MERNQFLNLSNCITKLERATKKKSAIMQIVIPDEVCEKFMNAFIEVQQGKDCSIRGFELSWIDKTIKVEDKSVAK